jgi:hypothetical protein
MLRTSGSWRIAGTDSIIAHQFNETNLDGLKILPFRLTANGIHYSIREVEKLKGGDTDLRTDERNDTETSCSPNPWLAVAHLASLYSYRAVFINIPRESSEMDFVGAFEKNPRMTMEGFYLPHHS